MSTPKSKNATKRRLSESANDAHSEVVKYQDQAQAVAHLLSTDGLIDEVNKRVFMESLMLIENLLLQAQNALDVFYEEARV